MTVAIPPVGSICNSTILQSSDASRLKPRGMAVIVKFKSVPFSVRNVPFVRLSLYVSHKSALMFAARYQAFENCINTRKKKKKKRN